MANVKPLIFGAIALIVGLAIYRYENPPELAGIHMVTKRADQFIEKRAGEIDQDTFGKKDQYTYINSEGKTRTDPNRWFSTAMGAATDVRNDTRRRSAAIARAEDRDESILSTETEVYQGDWATMKEIRVPTRIVVSGQVTPEWYPQYQSTPDGIQWTPEQRNRTVLMAERNTDNLGKYERLNAAIGRLCVDKDGVKCRLGFSIGSDAVLCVGPGFHEGGHFQGWYNGLPVIAGSRGNGYFSGATKARGKYKFVITPDDPGHGQTFATDICNQHPGALVVQNPKLLP